MQRVLKRFGIIALSIILVTLTACSLQQQARPVETIANSVAVLPFESDTPELAGFVAGVYEETLAQLALVPDLYIVGRDAMQPYPNMNLPPEEIARQLGVGRVVEGSIRYGDIGLSGRRPLVASVNRVYGPSGASGADLGTISAGYITYAQDFEGSVRYAQDLTEISSFQSEIASRTAAAVQEIVTALRD